MLFCEQCGYHLEAETLQGTLKFKCRNCHSGYESKPEDTLVAELNFETAETSQRFEVFEQNSAFDTAGKKVDKECPKCQMPYMTKIYIGADYVMKYTCTCGYKVIGREFKEMKSIKEKKPEGKEEA